MLAICLGWKVERMDQVDGDVLTDSGVVEKVQFHQDLASIEKIILKATILTSSVNINYDKF